MDQPNERLERFAVVACACLFFVGLLWLAFRQYAVFHLWAPDVVRFTHGMWRSLHGFELGSTIDGRAISSYHFSPIFRLYAPALWVWEDPRVFFVIQAAGFALTGVMLYFISKEILPRWAWVVPVAFYLNPAVHEVAINELRRITLATPFIALALYGLVKKNNLLLMAGLGIALLCKEDVAILIFTFGLFKAFVDREWGVGSGIATFGVVSFLLISLCVIPSLHPSQSSFGCYPDAYPQLNYFGVGDQTPDDADIGGGDPIATFLGQTLFQPLELLQHIFDQPGRVTVFRVLLPLMLVLPLIGWEWFLLAVPSLALMMMSTKFSLHTLRDWYLAPIMPILFVAVVYGISRLPHSMRRYASGGLLLFSLIGLFLYSPFPGGRAFNPVRYQLTDHHRMAWSILEEIPAEASVMAQDAFTAPLATRETVYHLGTNSETLEFDYLIVDRKLKHSPFDITTLNSVIDNFVADPTYMLKAEADGIFLFEKGGDPNPSTAVGATAEAAIYLDRVELGFADEDGVFRPNHLDTDLVARPGETARITLYWESVGPPVGNRSVSVRMTDPTGWVVAQHDSVPSNGQRPTVVWEPGWAFRDVYYLTIPEGTERGEKVISVLLYDSVTLERVPFDQGDELFLATIDIQMEALP